MQKTIMTRTKLTTKTNYNLTRKNIPRRQPPQQRSRARGGIGFKNIENCRQRNRKLKSY